MPVPPPPLPLLALRIGAKPCAASCVLARWAEEARPRPGVSFARWGNLSSTDKHRLLHDVARNVNKRPDTKYVGAYEQMPIGELMRRNEFSVEHVVPRSHVNGPLPGAGEDDPRGWVDTSRRENRRRSNLPLVLWDDPGLVAGSRPWIAGTRHYAPPPGQRARLARKWLFIRATYDGIASPSQAQLDHADAIVHLAATTQPSRAELAVDALYRKRFGAGNPLLNGDKAWGFYGSPEWVAHALR